jgi:uncharacterized protein
MNTKWSEAESWQDLLDGFPAAEQERLCRIISEAVGSYEGTDAAHDFDHALRVTRLARRVGREEGGDLLALTLAGVLHDVARADEQRTGECHAKKGAEIAAGILERAGYDPSLVVRVKSAVAEHRFRGERKTTSLEGAILFDCDKLDSLGAIGVARAFVYAGVTGQRLYADKPEGYTLGKDNAESGEHTPTIEWELKLSRVLDSLNTTAAQRIGRERDRFMTGFFQRLAAETFGQE